MNAHVVLERVYLHTGIEVGTVHRWLCRRGAHHWMYGEEYRSCLLCRTKQYAVLIEHAGERRLIGYR